LLLQERVRGTVVKTIFLAGDERDSALAAERSALWLARFHALAPQAGPVADLDHHRACFARWERRLAELGGALADKSARLRERLDGAAAALDEADLCAGHGSYSYDHVILSNDRTAVIDWDGYDVADPARDVARFVIALERFAWNRGGSVRAMDANAHVFERTYAAHAQADVAPHLPFYKAAICLKLAKYGVSHRVSQWRERVEAMLDEGLRILEQHA
jgi:aminoglycoside phosphotransferase (APT) family kinase protein